MKKQIAISLTALVFYTNCALFNSTSTTDQKASEIRNNGMSEKPPRSIKTPDALVLATAIIYKVDALHTLEDKMKKLNGSSTVDGLRICAPCGAGGQKGLIVVEPKDDEPDDSIEGEDA